MSDDQKVAALLYARNLILTKGWAGGNAMARTEDGKDATPWNTKAVRFGLSGALMLAETAHHLEQNCLIALTQDALGGKSVFLWESQPGRTVEEVLKVLDDVRKSA